MCFDKSVITSETWDSLQPSSGGVYGVPYQSEKGGAVCRVTWLPAQVVVMLIFSDRILEQITNGDPKVKLVKKTTTHLGRLIHTNVAQSY